MPNCKKCNAQFSRKYVKPDGVETYLGGRSYCLECSPFDQWKQRRPNSKQGQTLRCLECGKSFIQKTGKKAKANKCGACYANLRRFNLKKRMIDYRGGQCVGCGYSQCEAALTFHHIDPATKLFNLSGHHCRRWESIRIELDKCVLVCQNCHSEIHAGIRKI